MSTTSRRTLSIPPTQTQSRQLQHHHGQARASEAPRSSLGLFWPHTVTQAQHNKLSDTHRPGARHCRPLAQRLKMSRQPFAQKRTLCCSPNGRRLPQPGNLRRHWNCTWPVCCPCVACTRMDSCSVRGSVWVPACKRGCGVREAARQCATRKAPAGRGAAGLLITVALSPGLAQRTSPLARWRPPLQGEAYASGVSASGPACMSIVFES